MLQIPVLDKKAQGKIEQPGVAGRYSNISKITTESWFARKKACFLLGSEQTTDKTTTIMCAVVKPTLNICFFISRHMIL